MPRFRRRSIKAKVTLIIMLASSISLLLACMAFISFDRLSFEQAMVAIKALQTGQVAAYDRHGATISVESEEGKGTHFVVSFTVDRPDESE